MANTTDYSRLLDGYALLAIKEYIKNNYAAKSHTHTKSQITDFPSSMPANGGTSDYTNYLNITSTRLGNGSNKLQFMQYSGATDNPSNDWYSHIVMHHANNNGYYTEIATHFHGDNVYFRRKTNGTVGEWKRLAFTGEAAAAHHLYHTWDNNTNYYDSNEGGNMFRIITENMYADIFRFQASTVANLEYHNGSAWVAWSFDLSNLFDGNARTGVSIPYANRKFRFTMRTNGGWPTTGMFMLQGTWFSDGGWPNGQKSDIIIETRANESASWTQRATFTLSGVEGMAGHTLSALHTGETYYRITITIYPWTNTSNNCPLQRLCLFSNYNGGALEKITHDGYGNVTIPTLKSTTIYENGTTLANKYLGKTAQASDSAKLNGQAASYYLNYNNLTNKPTIPSGASLWNSGSTTWNVSNNVTCAGTGEWSFDCNGDTASNMWHVWSSKNSKTILACYPYDNRVEVPNGNFLVSGTISEGGTTLANKYLGKTAKAADSDLLDGHDSSYFINTSNIGSQYVYHASTSDYATDAGTAANSTSLGGNGPAYYLNYNNFTNKPSAVLYTSQSLTDAQKTQARSNIGAGTSSLAIGTTASTAAAGNHTHTLSIASGGTSSINLQANTTYTLTAGGSTLVFKTPSASASSAYYANQYNYNYFLDSASGAFLFSTPIESQTTIVGLQGGNAIGVAIGWPGLAANLSKKSLYFIGNRVDLVLTDQYQYYIKGLAIDMYDDDYYTLHIRANAYSDMYGTVNNENTENISVHANAFYIEPSNANSAVSNRRYVSLGVVMHNITYTFSSSVLLKINIRDNSALNGAITSYTGLCSLLYTAGHRSSDTCLVCSGRYSSYSYIVLGVYATAATSGLYLVYCTTSNNTVSTLAISNGTITDKLSVSLVP